MRKLPKENMIATGIGAAVRRKEDRRFITGKGHCTVRDAGGAAEVGPLGAARGMTRTRLKG
jgi:hypothetical protein